MATTVDIVNTLVEFGFVYKDEDKAELFGKSLSALMKDFVLPHCVCLPRTGVRYPRISPWFMKLMTKHGQDFLAADYEFGSMLLELAMQRISRHPDLPAVAYKELLPEPYKCYAASATNPNGYNGCPDEPGLWGTEEVEFLLAQLPTCLALNNAKWSEHAQTILYQLLTMLGDYCPYGGRGISWLEERYCAISEEKCLSSAIQIAQKSGLMNKMIDRCVGLNWRLGCGFYSASEFTPENEAYLLSKIDLNKERYFTGVKRALLKLFGKYEQKTKQKITEEIRSVRKR